MSYTNIYGRNFVRTTKKNFENRPLFNRYELEKSKRNVRRITIKVDHLRLN